MLERSIILIFKYFHTGKNNFAEVSINLAKYRFKNNFVGSSKYLLIYNS